jgi:two-component system cell cycle response regulator
LAEKLRSTTELHSFQLLDHQPGEKITVSIGVAVLPEDGLTVDRMIGKADAALYIAKDQGRNQVVAA